MRALGLVLLLWAGAALAEAPTQSDRPVARGVTPEATILSQLRPISRPVSVLGVEETAPAPALTGPAFDVVAVDKPGPTIPVSLQGKPDAMTSSLSEAVAQTLAQTAVLAAEQPVAQPEGQLAKAPLAPMGIIAPTDRAVASSARPILRGGALVPLGVETVTALLESGAMSASADLPLIQFIAAPVGVISPLAPDVPMDVVAAPMGLVLTTPMAVAKSVRPQARVREDRSYVTRAQYRANQNVFALSPFATGTSLRPMLRPAALTRTIQEARAAIVRGSVCGDPAIQGELIGNVPGPGSCGIEGAVRLRSVAGITFAGETPRVDCTTALALKRWVERGAVPAIGNRGGGLAQLSIMGTYSCRNRNGASAGRLSEHAFGRAFDIGGFKLRDGSSFTVLRDWGTRAWGDTLRALHDSACGPFGTVLGPNANAAHRNHFHFDTARYRAGSYCR